MMVLLIPYFLRNPNKNRLFPSSTNQILSTMAKVKLSALVSEMRGKLNGSVFSRNRGGAYLRTKVTPANPQTSAQVAARALLATYAQGWRSLTAAQRTAWNAAVSNFKTTDVFGDLKEPTGLQLYIRLNANIVNAGGSAITTPPVPVGVTALTTLSLSAAVTGTAFDVTFAATPVPTGHTLIVEATPQVSPGISNANSLFRVIGSVAAAGTSPADLSTEYTAKFGSLVAGQKIFIRAKVISTATGEVSQSLVASAIVGS